MSTTKGSDIKNGILCLLFYADLMGITTAPPSPPTKTSNFMCINFFDIFLLQSKINPTVLSIIIVIGHEDVISQHLDQCVVFKKRAINTTIKYNLKICRCKTEEAMAVYRNARRRHQEFVTENLHNWCPILIQFLSHNIHSTIITTALFYCWYYNCIGYDCQ